MLNPKYQRAMDELKRTGVTTMRVFGNSMTPIISSGTELVFITSDDYGVGDIVFCRVRGRIIDAHKITAKNPKRGWLISNNHGHDNGWTKTIFGKVITIGSKAYHSN
jgi:hypothetical protein